MSKIKRSALTLVLALLFLVSVAVPTFAVSDVIEPAGSNDYVVEAVADIVENGSTADDSTELTLQGERVYQIMTDRFYDGDPTNNATGEALRYQEVTAEDMTYMKGGDWQGIIDKIPYIKGMGYTAIWISPVTDPQLWSMPDENGVQGQLPIMDTIHTILIAPIGILELKMLRKAKKS